MTSAVLLAVAPVGPWPAAVLLPESALRCLSKPWHASPIRITAVAVTAGVALAIAVAHSPPF